MQVDNCNLNCFLDLLTPKFALTLNLTLRFKVYNVHVSSAIVPVSAQVKGSDNNLPIIAGATVCGLAVVGLVIVLVIVLLRRNRQAGHTNAQQSLTGAGTSTDGSSTSGGSGEDLNSVQRLLTTKKLIISPSIHCFSPKIWVLNRQQKLKY